MRLLPLLIVKSISQYVWNGNQFKKPFARQASNIAMTWPIPKQALGRYSPTILKNTLGLFFQDFYNLNVT